MYKIMVEDSFAAAHQLIGYHGPCEQLHGHTWKVQLFIEGAKLNDQGLLIDFRQVKKVFSAVLEKFDHQCLNKLKVFKNISPTSENVARLIHDTVKVKFRGRKAIFIKQVTVFESEKTSASYREG